MFKRSAVITVASVAGVLTVGSVAMAANLGVLDQSDAAAMGELQAADLPVAAEASVTTQPAWGSQEYTVADAGSLTVETSGSSIRLGPVAPAEGWTWAVTQGADDSLSVTFTSARTSYVFLAKVGPDGLVEAGVGEPVTVTVPVPVPGDAGSDGAGGSAPATGDRGSSAGGSSSGSDDSPPAVAPAPSGGGEVGDANDDNHAEDDHADEDDHSDEGVEQEGHDDDD